MSDTGFVYVVDDDASVREGVARLIRSAGVMTQTFASGEEFLAAARAIADEHGALLLFDEVQCLSLIHI